MKINGRVSEVMNELLDWILGDHDLLKTTLTALLHKRERVAEALSELLESDPKLRGTEPMMEVLLYALRRGEDLFDDPLTKVRDRRLFEAGVYEQLLSEAIRYGCSFTVVMIDIDGFKVTNDTFGHSAGDRLLKKVAEILSQKIREADVIIRHGGDEFLLVLPHTDTEGAGRLMGRVEKALSALSPQISISFGIACWIPGSEPIGLIEMVTCADEEMYAQKRDK